MGHDDKVVGHLDLRLPDHKPLARTPLILRVAVAVVVAALHSNNRLLVLAHGELLQVVVGLEQNLANAGACKPGRFETLHLHRVLRVGHVHGVKGKQGFPLVAAPDLQRNGEILKVHGCRRLHGRGHLHGVVLPKHQAAHALGHWAVQPVGNINGAGDVFNLPTNIEFLPALTLCLGLLLVKGLFLLLEFPEHELGQALAVQQRPLAALGGSVGHVPDREVAVAAELQPRVHCDVRVCMREGSRKAQVPLQFCAHLVLRQCLAAAKVVNLPREGGPVPPAVGLLPLVRLSEALAIQLHRQVGAVRSVLGLSFLRRECLGDLHQQLLALERRADPARAGASTHYLLVEDPFGGSVVLQRPDQSACCKALRQLWRRDFLARPHDEAALRCPPDHLPHLS
mmetsp:Transcript_84408/g.266466  ORF Transcript_84408/g.266466 Transcript_84408/m.266466 type:complete len:397 (-) Transcript_84408:15-1205(-)